MSTVTVLTGPERRRRWTAQERARIVEESYVAGAIVAEVARRHDVNTNLLHLWRRQARAATGKQVKFLPLTIARAEDDRAGAIEIDLDSGVRVRVGATVDEEALRRVLRPLGR